MPWYEKNWIFVILFIVCTPVGYNLYKKYHGDMSKNLNHFLSLLSVLWLLGLLLLIRTIVVTGLYDRYNYPY